MNRSFFQKLFLYASCISIIFGLTIMFYSMYSDKTGMDLVAAVLSFFSYFTILTNTFIAIVYFTEINKKDRLTDTIRGSVLVYILLTGIIYFFFLKNIWNPEGPALVGDIILHYISPVLFLIYFFVFRSGEKLDRNFFVKVLVFPLIYFIFTLITGIFTGVYPYPFMNAVKLGHIMVLINSFLIMIVIEIIAIPVYLFNSMIKQRDV